MCDVPDIIDDIVDVVTDVVDSVIGWIVPDVEIPDFGTSDFDDTERGILLNKQSNDASIPVIYGERLVGGTRVFISSSGTDNKYLYVALVMSEGEINSIEEILVDDKTVTFASSLTDGVAVEVSSSDANFYKADPTVQDSTAESLIRLEPHFGTDGQSASSLLSTLDDWGSTHKLSGLCYLAIRFTWNPDAFAGIPKVQAKIKGRKIKTYNASLEEQSASYSTNPSWCLLDYLTNARYGKGLSVADMDLQSFYDASLICETQVTPYSGASDINLFDCNAVIDTSKKVIDNVRDLIKGCRGYLPYTAGKYKLIIEATGSATITLTEDDIFGGLKLASEEKNTKYNRVICSFINPERSYQVDQVQYPPLDETGLANEDKHETMKAEDGGFLLEGRFDFKTLTSPYQAEEMAEIILRRSRTSKTMSISASAKAYDLAIGDIVNITHSSLGYVAKPFRVVGATFNQDFTMGLSLIEHSDAFYTWSEKSQQAVVPTTNLPNPFSVEKPSLIVTDELFELFDGSVVSKLIVTIVSTDKFVNEFEVEYKESGTTDYRLMRRGSNKIIEKYPVKEGTTYNIRARAINSIGSKSAYETTQHEVNSAFEPPDTVQNYSIDVVGDKLHHTFDAVTNLDLDFYEIRFTSDTTETVYANTTVFVPRIARPATSVVTPFVGTGKYFIKAVDKFGVRSATSTSVVISEQVIDGIKPITTITEETAFTGTKTDCVAVDNALILDTSDNFDDGVGNVDDALGLFDGGNNSVASSGTYDFDGFDFGAKFKIKLLLNEINVDHLDYVDNFDSQSGLFDSKQGLFDGNTDEAISSNVQLQIALSNDNVTFGSYQNFKAGDYVARAVKFRAVLTSTDTSATPKINNLSIKLLLPTVIQDGSNVSSGTDIAGKVITFDNQYYQTPTLTIIAQDLNTGDYFALNSKSASNFNIEFFDSGGNTVDRTFDYQAVGLGSQQ
jgi:hypothetical protein